MTIDATAPPPSERPARREFGMLLGLALVAAGLLAFVLLAGEIVEGETLAFDRRLLLALRNPLDPSSPLGPTWLEEAARDVTGLGSFTVLGFLVAAVAGFLALARRRGAALLVLAAALGALALSQGLKLGFERPRPDLVPHGARVYTASFPSGHATLSAAIYLTLGALAMRLDPRRRVKALALALAVVVALAVGLSRVYLGVHWPTDVLGGWCLGALWALACWLAARRLQRRGLVERPGEKDPA